MTDSTRFEDRLTVALGRYADRVPVDVDPIVLAQGFAADQRTRPRVAVNRLRLSLAIVVVAGLTLVGLAVFGGRSPCAGPSGRRLPSPSASAAPTTPTRTPGASPTPAPTASLAPTADAVLHWTEQDIGAQPAVTSIWRVGDWFVAVGPVSSFADDDQHVAARFIRSRDGQTWAPVPAPARGMEVETGTVADGTLWVGRQARHDRRSAAGNLDDGRRCDVAASGRRQRPRLRPRKSRHDLAHERRVARARKPLDRRGVTGGLGVAIE